MDSHNPRARLLSSKINEKINFKMEEILNVLDLNSDLDCTLNAELFVNNFGNLVPSNVNSSDVKTNDNTEMDDIFKDFRSDSDLETLVKATQNAEKAHENEQNFDNFDTEKDDIDSATLLQATQDAEVQEGLGQKNPERFNFQDESTYQSIGSKQ